MMMLHECVLSQTVVGFHCYDTLVEQLQQP